jgi:hypothetical protein
MDKELANKNVKFPATIAAPLVSQRCGQIYSRSLPGPIWRMEGSLAVAYGTEKSLSAAAEPKEEMIYGCSVFVL